MTETLDTTTDQALKARHRAMWALGDYPAVATDVIAELGPVLVAASGVQAGDRVLDVAAGSGNAAVPAALAGARVVASDLTPELFAAGREFAAGQGVTLDWEEGDAEALPYADSSFDTVLSCVGVMFAPHHQEAADELVRVCRPGGTVGLLSWTPQGTIGQLFATMKPFVPPAPPGVSPPPLWGGEDHLRALFGGRVEWTDLRRQTLEVTAFPDRGDLARHFTSFYGPTIATRANAAREGREQEFDAALSAFCDEWDRGADGQARFELEYLLAVGTRR